MKRKTAATRRLVALTLCCLIGHLLTGENRISGQQTDNLSQQSAPTGSGGQKPPGASQRIGLAPHDRAACQLPAPGRRPQSGSGDAPQLLLSSPVNRSISLTGRALQPDQLQPEAAIRGRLISKQFDSSERLRQLRQLLVSNSYDAYLVTPNDEHGSEYVSEYDRRLRFISGFTGSNGYALILLDRAVLFTDGRYALQADEELDCNWWLVVSDEPLADLPIWLRANAAQGLKVATDARLMSLQSYDYLDEHIKRMDSEFALISQDLIDVVWSGQQGAGQETDWPQRNPPRDPLFVHQLQFAGNVTWQEKLIRLAEAMNKLRARHYIVSQLDDIAWLLNLRGNDIPMSPLFKSYLLISRMDLPVTAQKSSPIVDQLVPSAALQSPQVLQLQPSQSIKLTFYVDIKKIGPQVRDHLNLDTHPNGTIHVTPPQSASTSSQQLDLVTGGSGSSTRLQVELKDYDVFIMDIRDKLQPTGGGRSNQLQGRLLLDAGANVAIHVLAKGYDDRLVLVESLINKLKAVKSEGEVNGMRLAHWRDSLAIAMLLAQLELDIGTRQQVDRWTEVGAASELEFYRSLMDFNKGLSFPTISAYGSNGAIVHYQPSSEGLQRPIGNQSTYLLDSGGQYEDGTTDITRTVHYGQPTDFQRETYTRVLMGAVDMMSLIFDQPRRAAYRLNDLLARRHLFELGLDYAHGTGHGIGLYSLVHEAPALIENYATGRNAKGGGQQQQRETGQKQPPAQVLSDPVAIQANMFTSVEPGYYKAQEFGIRLENIVVTQRVRPPTGSFVRQNDRSSSATLLSASVASGQQSSPVTNERHFLRFEPISLVPFEPKLIKFELLSNRQKAWLNSYNLMVRLRMTQQINHYLTKIQRYQQQQQLGARASSRLVLNRTSDSSASFGQLNFLRLEPAKLQEKLELTHKWIMSKTELIPLDVPQSLVAGGSGNQNNSSVGRWIQSSSVMTQDTSSQRLMLVYMASLPFNDQEAGEAAAALASDSSTSESLGGRMSPPNDSQNFSGKTSESDGKCSGFECDLWLLDSINSHHRNSQTGSGSHKSQGSSWVDLAEVGHERRVDRPSIMDLFQLGASGSSSSQLGSYQLLVPLALWCIVALAGVVVIQLGLASCFCGARRQRRRQSTVGTGTQASAQVSPAAV